MDACGCCSGTGPETPRRLENRPGLPLIHYRVGTHPTFRRSMLARLASAHLPALAGLRTRDEDDFTIALLDAGATLLDVLTFYQERLANEAFLRTATDRESVLELARLIGYELAPGVAASTHLAFQLQTTPGAPEQAAEPVMVPVGTRVQSVPGPDEDPQTFETVAEALARADWNAIPVQVSERWIPAAGDTDLWLAGTTTQLAPGDAILIVGSERLSNSGSDRWDVRVVREVEADLEHDRTRVAWNEGLGKGGSPAQQDVRVYAFRQRAALFGHNAPDPRMLNLTGTSIGDLIDTSTGTVRWKDFTIGASSFDLDASYPKVVPGSWITLVSNDPIVADDPLPGVVALYRAARVAHPSRFDYAISAKVTRVVPDTTASLSSFDLRKTLVLAQSEEVPAVDRPLFGPIYGVELPLGHLIDGLQPGQAIAVAGKLQRLRIAEGAHGLALLLEDASEVSLTPGDVLTMHAPPERLLGAGIAEALSPEEFAAALTEGTAELRLPVVDRDGRPGTLVTAAAGVELAPTGDGAPAGSEVAFIDDAEDAVSHDRDRTMLRLAGPLRHCYDRTTALINANVARATHGETVSEVLGSGDAAARDQRFQLKQAPLTFVSAGTPTGRASTLRVRVNDLLWEEVPTLFERGPEERVYELQVEEGGRGTVLFGDGSEGSRLPTGRDNLRATYRKGLGLGGNLPAGRLTNLLTRPLGVSGVSNPEPATGGEDPEPLAEARANAPLGVLTLDRAVSILDYADYARAFAGIAKAHAVWIPSGPARGVFLTVAGIGGASVPETGDTFRNLIASLRRFGDPLVPLRVVSYAPAHFRVEMAVKVAEQADPEIVLPAVEAELRARFGFAARDFGQTVSVDELAAAAHAVPGVVAVNLTRLHRVGEPPALEPRLFARVPIAAPLSDPEPAEMLLLADEYLELGVIP